ncbi:hypothetical protein Tco_0715301 [Tanacetum coccineum]
MEEVHWTIDEAKLKKMADEMLRQRLERKFLSLHIHERPHLSFKAVKSLINQDLLYLKKGSSGPEKIVLSLHKRSTRLTPPVPIPNFEKEDEMILQDTLQVSLAEHKSQEEQEARENVELVNKHLASEEIEKLVSPEVEKTNVEEVEVTNVVIPVNVNEEEDEITDEVYELK